MAEDWPLWQFTLVCGSLTHSLLCLREKVQKSALYARLRRATPHELCGRLIVALEAFTATLLGHEERGPSLFHPFAGQEDGEDTSVYSSTDEEAEEGEEESEEEEEESEEDEGEWEEGSKANPIEIDQEQDPNKKGRGKRVRRRLARPGNMADMLRQAELDEQKEKDKGEGQGWCVTS